MKKTSSAATTYFAYDEAAHLIGECDSAGDAIQETVWLGDIPVATLKPTGGGGVSVFYIHADHLDTPRRITRPSDNVILWRWDSDPFGATAANDDPDGDTTTFAYNLRFPGQYFDAETGLHYNDFRYYDPATGKYTTSDPIGLAGGLNTYGYVLGNPLSLIDPTGLDWIEYTGQRVYYYGGILGDRSNLVRSCAATSGGPMNQTPSDQNLRDVGPVPAAQYRVNLGPDPSRIARADPRTAELYSNPAGGIEQIPGSFTTRDGSTYTYPGWGTWRMRLEPVRGNTFGRSNFYLHNSHKGFTHGCVETCDELLNDVLKYRSSGALNIDVLIRYTTPTTNGGTKR